MNIQEEFDSAVARSKTLTERPSNEVLLKIYGLFKQATEGDNTKERPTGFDFKAIAKYDAWLGQKGRSSEDCMKDYVALINSLK